MIPRTVSASSLAVAEKCMRRWKAENLDRVPGMGGNAASLGTTCHAALEKFVEEYLKNGTWSWDDLSIYYQFAFGTIFGFDSSVPEYDDGLQMLNKWFSRTSLDDRTVLSCESKESFDIPTSAGKIKFNYIIDRLDQIGEDEYEVVDYKSQRFPIDADELANKIQAKAYALAVQIKYPNAKKIWVTFDLLRHAPVSIRFTRQDNVNTWAYLKQLVESIVQTPETKALPTLNSECRFCTVKTTCPKVSANIRGGGTHSIDTPDKAAEKLYQAQAAIAAATQIKEEMSEYLMKHAAQFNITDWESEDGEFSIAVGEGRGRRTITDMHRLLNLLPSDVIEEYGKIGVTELDAILKSGKLDRETAGKVRKLVGKTPGNIGVTVKAKR